MLISERKLELVVDLRKFDGSIRTVVEYYFRAGASVRLQTLINFVKKTGYGGIEYLFSVPGLVGGAVLMNARRGRQFGQSISDYIVSVDVIRASRIYTIQKEDCKFEYRNSAFKYGEGIIISVLFRFESIESAESKKRKYERIELSKLKQDASTPNFGSVFIIIIQVL